MLSGSDIGVVPKETRALNRNGNDAETIKSRRRAFLGGRFLARVMPSLDGLRPERKRLNHACLAAIVGADQHGRVIQLNPLLVLKPFEVLKFNVV